MKHLKEFFFPILMKHFQFQVQLKLFPDIFGKQFLELTAGWQSISKNSVVSFYV